MRVRTAVGLALIALLVVPAHAARRRAVTPPDAALVAEFTVSKEFAAPGEAIRFDDVSTGGAQAWTWSFGDGATSTERNPTHAYAASGTYTTELLVKNASREASTHRSVLIRIDVTGKWKGRANSGAILEWDLTQQGIAITGTSTFTFNGLKGTGPMTGTIAGDTVTLHNDYVMNDAKQCRGATDSTLIIAGAVMSGPFTLKDCEGSVKGTLIVDRQ